jgi:hypothetical protein
VDYSIKLVDNNKDDLNALLDAEKKLVHDVKNFKKLSQEFREFLFRTRTLDSMSELYRLDFLQKGYNVLINSATRKLQSQIDEHKMEEKSVSSKRSRTSTRTSQSSVITRKSAKAEAARVSLQFAKEAAELKKRQALVEQQYAIETASAKARIEGQKLETQADLDLLQKEQEAAEAEAEMNVLKSFDGDDQNSHRLLSSLPESDSRTKTKDYVENLSVVSPKEPNPPNVRHTGEQTPNANNFFGDQGFSWDYHYRND